MKINTRIEGGVTILDLVGKLIIGEGDVMLRENLGDLLEGGVKEILLNLEGVRLMDSSGLGELVRARSSAGRAGANIKLLHVEDKVQDVLEMTQLIGVFETYDDETDAIMSFRTR